MPVKLHVIMWLEGMFSKLVSSMLTVENAAKFSSLIIRSFLAESKWAIYEEKSYDPVTSLSRPPHYFFKRQKKTSLKKFKSKVGGK